MSVPRDMPIEYAQTLAMSKHAWLAERLQTLHEQYKLINARREDFSHTRLLWGERYELVVLQSAAHSSVYIEDEKLHVALRDATLDATLERWYRSELTAAIVPMIEKWTAKMGTAIGPIVFQRMKTRWGTCNNASRRIRLNTELAKKPPIYLEYVLVHEIVHYKINNHGADFKAAMDSHIPNWQTLQRELQVFPRE